MPTFFSEENSADAVLERYENAPPRLKAVMAALVPHLHAFIKEARITMDEWEKGIDFLTRTGQTCDDVRQEFILLSDVLGVSMLVDAINNRKPDGAMESTVLGPFHMVESPARELGATIALDGKGEPLVVEGRVTDPAGRPVRGATVDVWQANDDGFYDVQQPDLQPHRNLRGLFRCDDAGRFWFRTVLPRFYPIPHDGPVGEHLAAAGRHPNRPAHLHIIAAAPGFDPVVTHVFVEGDPWLESDAVFGVKESLVKRFDAVDDPRAAERFGLANPFRHVDVSIGLAAVRETTLACGPASQ